MSVKTDVLFAVVPEWIVYAEVGPQAVRLYAALARHADKETGHAHPSRRRLAELLRCSSDTVDRALKELVGIGALTVGTRKIEGSKERDTNDYVVHVMPIRGRADAATGQGADAATGSRMDAAENESHLERESEEREKLAVRKSDPKRLAEPDAFAVFWDTFALKADRPAAERAWNTALKTTAPAMILAGARRYVDWRTNHPDPPTQKYAQGWLNGRRWEDELPPYPSNGNGRSTGGQRTLELAQRMREQGQ